MMIQKFLPEGPVDSTMYYEVYKNKHSSDEDFRFIADMYRKVMGEDKVLCEGQMGNLKTGVFTSGELHPQWERGKLKSPSAPTRSSRTNLITRRSSVLPAYN